MTEMITVSKEEVEKLKERAKKLAVEKSNLALINHMMEKLSAVSGLENTIDEMLRILVDSIGGVNLLIYIIDNNIYRADVYGKKTKIESIDDPSVKKAIDTREFIEYENDFSDTKMLTPEFTKAFTWVFPLLAGPEIIGAIKMEDLHISTGDLKPYLKNFFNYAAIILKNEMLGHTRLQKAYDELEKRIMDRTMELQAANERLQKEIDERKETDELLKEREEYIRRLIENSPIAKVVSSGADEKVILVNRKFTELFGYTIEDMPNVERWWPLAYPDGKYREDIKARWKASVDKAIRERSEIEPIEATVSCKDGSRRYIEFRLSSIGKQHIVTFIDLTDRKRAEEGLRRLNNELETRVAERTAELEEKNAELERMNKLFVGRELKMIELKDRIKALEEKTAHGVQPVQDA